MGSYPVGLGKRQRRLYFCLFASLVISPVLTVFEKFMLCCCSLLSAACRVEDFWAYGTSPSRSSRALKNKN